VPGVRTRMRGVTGDDASKTADKSDVCRKIERKTSHNILVFYHMENDYFQQLHQPIFAKMYVHPE